jgi:hypothetical protein
MTEELCSQQTRKLPILRSVDLEALYDVELQNIFVYFDIPILWTNIWQHWWWIAVGVLLNHPLVPQF